MRSQHLTKKIIEAFAFAGGHEKAHDIRWDRDLRGFGVRVFPSGAKTYVFRFTTQHGRKRLFTICRVGELTLEKAREKALRLRTRVLDGADPASERSEARQVLTLNAFADRYLAEHAARKKKASSAHDDARNLELHIRPKLGARPLPSISRADVIGLHNGLAATPYLANRMLALLSKMFNLAERWGMRADGSNPCRHVERFTEARRERFLSTDELRRLARTLESLEPTEDPNVLLAVRLLVLTGCRLNEILTLRWSEVRLDNAQLWLEDSKTGRKTVWLSHEAVALLQAHRGLNESPYVIRGSKPGSHLVNMQKPWRRIRSKAGLEGVRLHDLRHTYASVAASRGLSLPMIGALLGHRNTATTARYAHLANDAAQQAARVTGLAIGESFFIEAGSELTQREQG